MQGGLGACANGVRRKLQGLCRGLGWQRRGVCPRSVGEFGGEVGRVILCEDGPEGRAALFEGASAHVFAWEQAEVAGALARVEAARQAGNWIAGYMSYEAGFALEPKLAGLGEGRSLVPLLAFGIYDGPADAGGVLAEAAALAGGVRVAPVVPVIDFARYSAAFEVVKAYIAAGDCYQINLTFPLESALWAGSALGLYGALRARQAVGHGAFAAFDQGPVVVSRSPELFVRLEAGGKIEARPMKGTAPRDADPVEDALLAEGLRASAKDRAENLMIVDLLRNDIARISKVGSVKVPELFAVESYATVHQMVSRVVGQLEAPASLPALMAALFPCGSITGAPKIRAMEIIHAVETNPRGIYCGAIGWMAPDGRAAFNVAIRTLSVWPDGRISLNVGGGVVQDSTALGEWEEALWKAAYMQGLARV